MSCSFFILIRFRCDDILISHTPNAHFTRTEQHNTAKVKWKKIQATEKGEDKKKWIFVVLGVGVQQMVVE
jgi:hypothetical protein